MSMPLGQQAPPSTVTQQPYNAHPGHSSIGPVIAVLVVVIILSVLAVMIGRLCTGWGIMGYGEYDVERWIEVKCASCIDDGRVSSPPPPPRRNGFVTSVPATMPVQTHQETTQEQQSPPIPSPNVGS